MNEQLQAALDALDTGNLTHAMLQLRAWAEAFVYDGMREIGGIPVEARVTITATRSKLPH